MVVPARERGEMMNALDERGMLNSIAAQKRHKNTATPQDLPGRSFPTAPWICAAPGCVVDTRMLRVAYIAIQHSGRSFCCDACSEEWLDKMQDEVEARMKREPIGGGSA